MEGIIWLSYIKSDRLGTNFPRLLDFSAGCCHVFGASSPTEVKSAVCRLALKVLQAGCHQHVRYCNKPIHRIIKYRYRTECRPGLVPFIRYRFVRTKQLLILVDLSQICDTTDVNLYLCQETVKFMKTQ